MFYFCTSNGPSICKKKKEKKAVTVSLVSSAVITLTFLLKSFLTFSIILFASHDNKWREDELVVVEVSRGQGLCFIQHRLLSTYKRA